MRAATVVRSEVWKQEFFASPTAQSAVRQAKNLSEPPNGPKVGPVSKNYAPEDSSTRTSSSAAGTGRPTK